MNVIGYIRVSTSEQASSGAGLDAQRSAIADACHHRGLDLVGVYDDSGYSAANLNRPAIARALDDLHAGIASALIVAKLDRLSRSLLDFASLMERAKDQGWALIALDLGVDTTTPAGEMLANVLASFAQFERRLIGQRTREALAIRRSQGVRLGRPREIPQQIVDRILAERRDGMTLTAIADGLTRDGVPTARGGRSWLPSTIHTVLRYASAVGRGETDARNLRSPWAQDALG